MLEWGKAQSLEVIAGRKRRPVAEVKSLLPLAFLLPVLVEKALERRLPIGLNQSTLAKLGGETCWHSMLSRADQ
jgi:hypothetical protein